MKKAASSIEVSYFRAGSTILTYGEDIRELYIIRNGIVELHRRSGELYNRLDRGDIFGEMGLLTNNKVKFASKAIEDTLIYRLEGSTFYDFCNDYEEFFDYVEVENSTRLRHAVSSATHDNEMTTAKVKTLLSREAVFISGNDSIRKAAQIMTDENVSAVLVIDPDHQFSEDDSEESRFIGIITERDLTTRVLAQGVDSNTAISKIMSTELISLDHNDYIFEAMLTMLRKNIHHLPVLRDKNPIGILEITDIVRYESKSSLLLVSNIFMQQSVEELSRLQDQVRNSFVRLVDESAKSHMVGSAISVIGRSFIQRIAELGEMELGLPPVPYCLIVLGSMARDEQLIVTDQDNAFILGEEYEHEKHNEYFEKLAAFISDGLAACGYEYCPGEIMATNPEWRMTLSQWQDCFAQWIDKPEPETLLNSSIFFDLDGVWGQTNWAEKLKTFIARKARKNTRFLACLAGNAIKRTPPLGFFKQFVMEKDGRHNNTINLKRRGTAPLSDLIRVHALAAGSRAQNTFERLDDVIDAEILPKDSGPDLIDAMEFISIVRIRHQALNISMNNEPNNSINPDEMSDFERRNLKDAFQVLSKAQNFIKYRYSAKRNIS
ncbi:MAG: DUF294 nucleotidyltransferase-like domain-containing protein [Desulfonatronovibrio sp.]